MPGSSVSLYVLPTCYLFISQKILCQIRQYLQYLYIFFVLFFVLHSFYSSAVLQFPFLRKSLQFTRIVSLRFPFPGIPICRLLRLLKYHSMFKFFEKTDRWVSQNFKIAEFCIPVCWTLKLYRSCPDKANMIVSLHLLFLVHYK